MPRCNEHLLTPASLAKERWTIAISRSWNLNHKISLPSVCNPRSHPTDTFCGPFIAKAHSARRLRNTTSGHVPWHAMPPLGLMKKLPAKFHGWHSQGKELDRKEEPTLDKSALCWCILLCKKALEHAWTWNLLINHGFSTGNIDVPS